MAYVTNLTIPTVQLRYFAFNCLEIKLPGGKTIVIDPCINKEGEFTCGYDENELEGCDYVLVNHSHGDHVSTLGKVFDRFHPLVLAQACTAYDLCRLYDVPFIKVIPFTAGDHFDFGCFKVDILRGRHNSTAMFNIRPSGRIDETANARLAPFCGKETLENRLFNLGSMINSNFLITLPNNLKIGFFAGNPGMAEPEDANMWRELRPDIIFAHRCKYTNPNFANIMANVLDITGARIMMPIHIEDAYSGEYDAAEYVAAINKACEERGIGGRALFLERAKWYQFSTGVVQL